MYLYLLIRRDDGAPYDEAVAFVVSAVTQRRARKLAALQCGDEGADFWKNPQCSRIKCIGVSNMKGEQVVVRDYNGA